MKERTRFPTVSGSRGDGEGRIVAWEYRFCDAEELEAEKVTAEGWQTVSSRRRLDNRREYLLKRPRQ
jgi:hypothetical protein